MCCANLSARMNIKHQVICAQWWDFLCCLTMLTPEYFFFNWGLNQYIPLSHILWTAPTQFTRSPRDLDDMTMDIWFLWNGRSLDKLRPHDQDYHGRNLCRKVGNMYEFTEDRMSLREPLGRIYIHCMCGHRWNDFHTFFCCTDCYADIRWTVSTLIHCMDSPAVHPENPS